MFRLVVTASMLEATEGLSEGPVTSRPASLGLLLVSLTNVNNQLSRSQNSLADYKERLNSLQSLQVTELVRLAEVAPAPGARALTHRATQQTTSRRTRTPAVSAAWRR